MITPDKLPKAGITGSAPNFPSVQLNTSSSTQFKFPKFNDTWEKIKGGLFNPGSPGLSLPATPNLSNDMANKLNEVEKKAIEQAENTKKNIEEAQKKIQQSANSFNFSAIKEKFGYKTPIYEAKNSLGDKVQIDSMSIETQELTEAFHQRHIMTVTNAQFGKVKSLTEWSNSVSGSAKVTFEMPTIPGMGGSTLDSMVNSPAEINAAMREKIDEGGGSFNAWLDSQYSSFGGSQNDIPGIDKVDKLKVAQSKHTQQVIDYMGTKMSEIQTCVNTALSSLSLPNISVSIPTLPTQPSSSDVGSYVTGESTPGAPFNFSIPETSPDVGMSTQDNVTKMNTFFLDSMTEVTEKVCKYFDDVFKAMPAGSITITSPTVSSSMDLNAGTASTTIS